MLLVDESPVVREMWTAWLTFWGFIVEEARHAAEAVEKARIRLPDLIVMDLAVPVPHGRQAIHLLASDPATAAVPILAGSPQTYAVLPHASNGAEGFQPKPADPDHLLVQIRDTFRRSARTSQRHAQFQRSPFSRSRSSVARVEGWEHLQPHSHRQPRPE